MIASLASRLFPSPHGIGQSPFSSRLCILVPIVCPTQYTSEMSATRDLPVSPASSEPDDLSLQLYEMQYIVSSEDRSYKITVCTVRSEIPVLFFHCVLHTMSGLFQKRHCQRDYLAAFHHYRALLPVVCLGQTATSQPGDELAISPALPTAGARRSIKTFPFPPTRPHTPPRIVMIAILN